MYSLSKIYGAFAGNSDFPIPLSLQPDVVNLWYFKLWMLLDKIEWIIIGFKPLGWKEIWVCCKNLVPLPLKNEVKLLGSVKIF